MRHLRALTWAFTDNSRGSKQTRETTGIFRVFRGRGFSLSVRNFKLIVRVGSNDRYLGLVLVSPHG